MFKESICRQCKIVFEQKEIGSTFLYCSDECMRLANPVIKKTKPIHEFKCQLCCSKFLVINNLTAKYCSDKCRSLARYRKLTGKPIKAPRTKSEYGKGYIGKLGYRMIYRDHPNANKKTKIMAEHVFIMSQHLGRPMRKGETVHHKNGIRSDNRIENLELWTSRHPQGVRHEDRLKSSIAFLQEEGYKVVKE